MGVLFAPQGGAGQPVEGGHVGRADGAVGAVFHRRRRQLPTGRPMRSEQHVGGRSVSVRMQLPSRRAR